MEENSISIINKNNGQITGERTGALPVRLTPSLTWVQYVLIGIGIALLIAIIFVATIQKQVVVVEVSGRANNFQILEVQ